MMMKNKSLHIILFSIFFLTLFLSINRCITYAASDDPGAGRLSGKNIPEEFYDDAPFSLFRWYGASDEKNPYTNKHYFHQPVFDNRTIRHGIDVSEWQGTIDWNKVKADGIDFAFIRVGYRGWGTAGTLNENTKDAYFETNMKSAAEAGMPIGVYIFSQAITTEEAVEEADYILSHLGSYPITMPLIMDYEYASDSSYGGRIKQANLSKADATKVCLAFCERIADAGYTPMLYANKSMLENQVNAQEITNSGYLVWLANYTTETTYSGTFDFWQYSSSGTVKGISGSVDMNFYYAKENDDFFKGDTHIDPVSIEDAVAAAIPTQDYTGSDICPAVTLSYGGRTLVPNMDYTIRYENNRIPGTATITLTGIGSYYGEKMITFQIQPKRMSALTAQKRTNTNITLSWAKDASATGYQIYRATSLNGEYTQLKNITGNSTTSYKNTKLTSGQCYYYKIRSYITIDGTTYYGEFSPVSSLYTTLSYTRTAIAKSATVLYRTASTSDTVVLKPSKNKAMTVVYSTKDTSGNTWYYVSCKKGSTTYKGFVRSSKVTSAKQAKITKASKVNVRKSNKTTAKILTTLKKNKKVNVLSTKKQKGVTWYKVIFEKNGKTYKGWISAPYVKIV